MADVDAITLMVAIQAVHRQIQYFEELLKSETLRDPQEIQSLILSLESAADNLKKAYLQEWKPGSNLPAYETLVSQ